LLALWSQIVSRVNPALAGLLVAMLVY